MEPSSASPSPTPVVVHVNREPAGTYTYIGRPSKWGNPFVIGKDGTRDEVIDQYEEWIMREPKLLAALPELVGKRLGCFCAPLHRCHGHVLAKLVCQRVLGQR
jgi:hypothetical protein